jgi:hypothetical protein
VFALSAVLAFFIPRSVSYETLSCLQVNTYTTENYLKLFCTYPSSEIDAVLLLLLLLLVVVVVFSPWASLGRNQSPVRRPVWLWYAASWASS